jgi:hypothetical protein
MTPRSDDEIRADIDVVTDGWGSDRARFRLAVDVEPLLARAIAAEAEVERLTAENAELTAAHELMTTQFRTMQREKEHGWNEADRQEARAERAEAEVERLTAENAARIARGAA